MRGYRIAGPVVGLALALTGAMPTQAATATPTAGASWSQLMHRKLDLDTQTANLVASLPTLKAAITARNGDLTKAKGTQAAAATALTKVTAADDTAKANYTAATTAATAAAKAFTAAKKAKPANASKVSAALKALHAANDTVSARSAVLKEAWNALVAARKLQTTADAGVTRATNAVQAATDSVAAAQQKIIDLPALAAKVAAQAAALGPQVVTESRATFTMADTTKVYGITVNKVISYEFQHMIDDAGQAGVQLSGGGFRTKEQQIALRTTNGCPDVWTAPASSCRVPTAIPGHSLHELGLAVDMTTGGKTISSRTSPAWKWLNANAGKYGFTNLPSEPWHWSITGN
jgi:zinc D-Ala-D-Ala carboxypeptidase